MSIRAIETGYAGCRFRSRTEARWAVFLDHLGIRWEYEPQGLSLDGTPYLPDFMLPDMGQMTVEVKGRMEPADMRKVLLTATHMPVLVLGDIPRPDEPGPHFLLFLGVSQPSAARLVRYVSFAPYWGGWSLESSGEQRGPEDVEEAVDWAIALFESRPIAECSIPTHPVVASAFAAARSARFEHGESGPGVVPSQRPEPDRQLPLGPPPARLSSLLPGVVRDIAARHGAHFPRKDS